MGAKTKSLIETLTELSSLLRQHDEQHWASWIDSDLRRIGSGDLNGVTHLLSAYGGMGSFNDLVLHPANGHRVDTASIVRVNDALSLLRSRAWILADQISRKAVVE
jgi:hypothetical protein